MLNDLKEIIAIKSVLGEPKENAPFGEECRKALDWFLQKAQSFGLKTGELDGYCGWAEYGEGDECVAALCHLDVVPAGEGWSSDPYSLLIEGGRLYGRGVVDDKGCAVMCLHALKEIRESGLKTSKRIRLIVGLNEEHGSDCIKYYSRHGEIPVMSFVPDSHFPLINSEKGILHLGIRIPLDKFFERNVAFIAGGQSINVVPDRASVGIFKESPLGRKLSEICGGTVNSGIFSSPELVGGILASGASLDSFSVKSGQDVITIEAAGTAGHGSLPELADNAVWKIITVLETLAGDSKILETISQYFCTKLSAEKLGIYRRDEESGETTVNMGIIEVDNDTLYFTLDIRLPLSAKAEDVKKSVAAVLPAHSKMETLKYSHNHYVDKDTPLVCTLLEVYTRMTGNEGVCTKTGGGTYARALPNAVAFGPMFSDDDGNIHKADENMLVEDFYKAAAIYKEAMIKLAQ